MTPQNIERDIVYKGKSATIILPSLKKIQIRETNGDDDDILSDSEQVKNGMNVCNYLAGIITKDFSKTGDSKLVTPEEIMQWKNKDRYYALFRSRILNYGPDLVFKNLCDCETETEYTEALTEFDVDLSKPDTWDTNKNPFKITPYQNKDDEKFEFTIKNDRFRFTHMTLALETASIDKTDKTLKRNDSLTNRNIEVYRNGEWQKITFFKSYSSVETSLMRKAVKEMDTVFNPCSIIDCPACKKKTLIPIFELPAFYYPEEVI